NLIYSGYFAILFQLWTTARFALMRFLEPNEYALWMESIAKYIRGLSSSPELAFLDWKVHPETAFYAMMGYYLILLAIACYIGYRAVKVGQGGEPKTFYLILATVITVYSLAEVIGNFFMPDAAHPYRSLINNFVALLAMIAYIVLCSSGWKLRGLLNKKKEEAAA
ncbi:MAG: hypothetical protein HUJ54_15170, partial [Erysipelotrichaceae bacterium]|nr:hypothetical protein [Erysipelotrichaceae bacterium]